MFHNLDSSGKHMICDFKGIKNSQLLNSCQELKSVMNDICEKCHFHILAKNEHEFKPIGCSILFLLSESHLSLHTFPEKYHMSFDIYTCRQYENDDCYNMIYLFLLEKLQACPKKSVCQIINRSF